LREKGVREETLVILTSDHGLRGKATLYESGVHVPLIVNWPGRIQPAVHNGPVQHLDLVPTLLELADIEPDDMTLDGRSLTAVLSGEATEGPGRDSLYFEYGYARAVRQGPWKYIAVRYPDGTREAFAKGEIDRLPYLGHNSSLGRWQAPRFRNYYVADQLYHLGPGSKGGE
jgi:arylsulfatase A-like enzyme